MKRFLPIIILILFVNITFSQNFVMTWRKCYGGTGNDEVRSIIPHDNGYLFFGNTQSHDGDVLNNPLDDWPAGWLVGIDSIGNIEFDKYYTGFGTHVAGCKILSNESGYYLFGESGPNNYNNIDGYWFAKTDQDFNIVWQEVFGGSGDEEPKSLVITEDSGVIGLGRTTSNDGDIEINYGLWDNWLVSIDADGNKKWVKSFGCYAADVPGQIISTSDSNYLFNTTGYNIDSGNVYCPGHDLLNEEAKLIKINPSGEEIWLQCYGGSYTDVFSDIKESDDGYICIGTSLSNDLDLQGHHGIPDDDSDLWIAKTDLNGELQWSKLYGGSHWDVGLKIFSKSKGGFAAFGYTKSQNGDVIGNTTIQRTFILWMLEIDENGELLYQKPFIELENLSSMDILQVSDYKYVIATTKITHGCHHTYPNVNSDIYVFEIQDMDEFIPSQPIGSDQICLGNTTESYYSTQLVTDTMETQWLLIPEEAGTLTQLHDSVLIQWNQNFTDTALLQVRAVNEYGESSYSEAKEIIVYPPLELSYINGPDSLCTSSSQQSIFTTQIEENIHLINWYLEPETAGILNNQQDTAIISWNLSYEGLVSLKTAAVNPCGEEEYSSPKEISIKTCTGLEEQKAKELKIYPNPAKTQITFELPDLSKESLLQIRDVFGKTIAQLRLNKNQSNIIWNCSNVSKGVYFYQTKINGEVYRGKIVVN